METKEGVTVQTVGGMEVKYKKVFSISDEELKAFYGSVLKPGCILPYYAHNIDSLYRKNGISATPLN